LTKYSIGDKVAVDAQALTSRYRFVPNLFGLIKASNYNLNATVAEVRDRGRILMDAPEYTVAFDVAPSIGNLVFSEVELEMVSPVHVRKLDEAIAEAEKHLAYLKKYRETVVNGI
jgi:hypothetical protein